jgi:two-component system response regulator FixJ
MTPKERILVVDDDADFRASLQDLLEAAGFAVTAYESAHQFLDSYRGQKAICIVADIRMPGMDGLELQKELNARKDAPPVVIMTGHGDVPLAVRAMRAGAVDFLEKPFDLPVLLNSIERAREMRRDGDRPVGEAAHEAEQKIAALTDRERDVLDLLVAGHQNKVIAFKLDISPRTVEVHRARVLEKTGARSLPELVHICIAARRLPKS